MKLTATSRSPQGERQGSADRTVPTPPAHGPRPSRSPEDGPQSAWRPRSVRVLTRVNTVIGAPDRQRVLLV